MASFLAVAEVILTSVVLLVIVALTWVLIAFNCHDLVGLVVVIILVVVVILAVAGVLVVIEVLVLVAVVGRSLPISVFF